MAETLDRKIERINSKLTVLLSDNRDKQPETWVKSTVIINVTGWNHEDMRNARKYNYVSYKKTETGFWYLLESINPKLYKK